MIGRVQPAVAGRQQHVEHHLLGDRVADLHGAAGERFAFVRQLGAGERRAVNAVAARAAADGDDQIAGLRLLERLVARNQPDVAAEDQRIAEVAVVEVHRAVDRGNAHAVAVVAHARDDAAASRAADAARPAAARPTACRAGRSRTRRCCRRLGAQARAEDVADHAAEARVRAAVRLEGRRMIVRLDLEATLNSSSNRTTPALS